MKVVIVEDELLAREELLRLIKNNYSGFEVIACLDSVTDSVAWFKNNTADLIFLDIHLADGISFDIFEQVEITTPVIFTTAYDQYAVRAFQLNGIGYLLKPIVESDLVRAVKKLNLNTWSDSNLKQLLQSLQPVHSYKQRISTKSGDRYMSLEIEDIAYFYSEDRVTFAVTKENRRHIVDYTLEILEPVLDPHRFFRLTRNCIASIDAVKSVSKYFNSRLKITLTPDFEKELLVSRIKVPAFLKWLDGN
ncbi:MAG: LytTR family DNA-binding domain-containing protein [Candidatus Azobacteroides sp.]|nr:LytTR family DNA-binding domain-containing protein [Candidatus Azobacteroides sp.]